MGAVLMLLRVLSGVISIIVVLRDVPAFLRDILDGVALDDDDMAIAGDLVRYGTLGYAVWLTIYLILAWLVWRGSNWARIASMSLATVSILVPFIDWWRSGLDISLRTTLLSLALDILILLALSSRAARAYARRRETPVAEPATSLS